MVSTMANWRRLPVSRRWGQEGYEGTGWVCVHQKHRDNANGWDDSTCSQEQMFFERHNTRYCASWEDAETERRLCQKHYEEEVKQGPSPKPHYADWEEIRTPEPLDPHYICEFDRSGASQHSDNAASWHRAKASWRRRDIIHRGGYDKRDIILGGGYDKKRHNYLCDEHVALVATPILGEAMPKAEPQIEPLAEIIAKAVMAAKEAGQVGIARRLEVELELYGEAHRTELVKLCKPFIKREKKKA